MLALLPTILVTSVNLYVALPNNNMDKVRRLVNEVSDPLHPNYGKYMSSNDIIELTKSDPIHEKKVIQWFRESNITDCDVQNNYVKCRGKRRLFMRHCYIDSNLRCRIPATIRDSVVLIEGLRPMVKPIRHPPRRRLRPTDYLPDANFVTKEVLGKLYNFDDSVYEGTPSVGVAEFLSNGGFGQSDLAKTQIENGIINHTVTPNHIVGGNYPPPDGESVLDMSMIAQVSGNNSVLWYWNNVEWMYSFAAQLLTTKDVPDIISMSWGWSDNSQCSIIPCNDSLAYVKRTDEEFAKLALRGITLVSSSGDSGSSGRSNAGCQSGGNYRPLNPVYPTSSPYVLSVGGTFLLQNNIPYDHWKTPVCQHNVTCSTAFIEKPTMAPYLGWTTGGGISDIFDTTPWQEQELQNYLVSNVSFPDSKYYNRTGRGYPDVTAVSNYCSMVLDDIWMTEAGTSCSAPIWAGVISILNGKRQAMGKPKVGLVGPLLYHIKRNDPSCFNKILAGNTTSTEDTPHCGRDFGFSANYGQYWTPVYGLGSPDVKCILKYV